MNVLSTATVSRGEALLRERLVVFSPTTFLLTDDSAAHAGHAGAREGGHYALTLVSEQFIGMPRLARHRAVMAQVADLIPSPVHALSVRALAPGEAL
jgi:BolA family transcriptional regulator, general stress-responsive regulator